MKLTKEILKKMILEAISIGDTMDGDVPEELAKLGDFILSIPSDANGNPDQSYLEQAKLMAETLMGEYSDFLEQLRNYINFKTNRLPSMGPSMEQQAAITQFFELFDL